MNSKTKCSVASCSFLADIFARVGAGVTEYCILIKLTTCVARNLRVKLTVCCVQLKEAISVAAWKEVNDMYNVLKAAIYGDQGCASSTSSLRLEQPWLEEQSRLRV